MTRFLAILMGCLLLAGCAASNKYAESYTPQSTAAPQAEDFEPKVRRSDDLKADVDEYSSRGYTVLGSSDFTGELEDTEALMQQARATGATLVLMQNTFIETRTVDKTVYTPNRTTDNTTRVSRGAPTNTSTTRAEPPVNTGIGTSTGSVTARKGSIPNREKQEIYRQRAVFLKR